jgi:hypothetical protein
MNEVLIECDKPKCPYKVKVKANDTMPKGTVRIVSPCPWHIGDTGYELYFNAYDEQLYI